MVLDMNFVKLMFFTSLFTVLNAQTVSVKLSIFNFDRVKKEIENYVNSEIFAWQVQGKFESTEAYLKRVNTNTRTKKIEELKNKKINDIANESINLCIDSLEYEPDNEVYKIKFVGLPAIYINIPIKNNEALHFDRNKENLKFYSPKYSLTKDGFVLLKLHISDHKYRKTYDYNYQDKVMYNKKNIDLTFEPITINPSENSTKVLIPVDEVENINIARNIPSAITDHPNSVAVIIGNKDYDHVPDVDYAINDAKLVKKYMIKSFGLRKGNIIYRENISKTDFEEIFGTKDIYKGRLYNMIKPGVTDVIIYYSGHGAPGIRNEKAYLVPVECDPNYLEFRGYGLETLYYTLTKLPARSITVIMDACFTGEDFYQSISPVVLKVNNPLFSISNGVLLSSSQSNETSSWYDEEKHGLFTYFFLREICDYKNTDTNKDGQITYGELFNKISSQTVGIPYYSRRLHGREQNPTINGELERILFKYK